MTTTEQLAAACIMVIDHSRGLGDTKQVTVLSEPVMDAMLAALDRFHAEREDDYRRSINADVPDVAFPQEAAK